MKKIESNEKALKHLFGRELLVRMAQSLASFYPQLDSKAFLRLESALLELEMKARVHAIRDELKRQLPSEFKKALKLIIQSIEAGKLDGFDIWPFAEYIQTYGLHEPELSLKALIVVTRVFTSEWAVRPFIHKYPDLALQFLINCTKSEEVSVRRWASEGSRSRLPWGERIPLLIQDPEITLPILEQLKYDPEIFVRKSIANHLNDVSKDHPEFVIQTLTRWKKEAPKQEQSKIEWIIRHALRTRIKMGDISALELIGISCKVRFRIGRITLNKLKYRMGDKVEFSFDIESLASSPQKLVIDYILHYVRANGKTSPKVFKLRVFEIASHEKVQIKKVHHLKEVTIRKHYKGIHRIDIQINGKKWANTEFSIV